MSANRGFVLPSACRDSLRIDHQQQAFGTSVEEGAVGFVVVGEGCRRELDNGQALLERFVADLFLIVADKSPYEHFALSGSDNAFVHIIAALFRRKTATHMHGM